MNSTKLFDIDFQYPNRDEFLSLRREIVVEKIYNVELQEDPVIIDIGSHIGMSVLFFKTIYPKSTILAFEPNELAYEFLQKNVGTFEGVETFQIAVRVKEGMYDFYISNTQSEWLSNSSFIEKSWTGVENVTPTTVKAISLRNVLDEFEEIDLLKIDVEGYESKLVSDEVDLTKVQKILVECHPDKKNRHKKVLKALKNEGFQLKYRQNGSEKEYFNNKKLFVVYGYRK